MGVGLLASSAWLISMAALMPPILTLQVAVVSVRFFGLSRGAFRYAERIWSHDAILRSASSLQLKIYRALLARPPFTSSTTRQGKLLQQITTDVETVQDRWIRIVIPFFSALLSGWAGIGIITWLDNSIGIIVLLFFTITVVALPLLVGHRSQENAVEIFEAESLIADKVAESCRTHLEADMYGYQDALKDALHAEENVVIRSERQLIKRSGLAGSILIFFTYLSVIISFIMAVNSFQEDRLAGVNIAVVTLLPLVIFDGIPPLLAPLSLIGKIRRATANMDEVLNLPPTVGGQARLESGKAEIKLFNARARWDEVEVSHQPISVEVPNSSISLIQGESGIGKTSLALAVAGLLDYSGSIQINGIEVREISQDALRATMTVLLQDEHLFISSIRENLRIAKPDASDEEIRSVLEQVELADLVNALPEGLDTHIGAFGINFSGGEKQRLRLARIFLRETQIYILDEPFEHLEKVQADRILERLINHLHGKTLLVISHQEIQRAQHRVELRSI